MTPEIRGVTILETEWPMLPPPICSVVYVNGNGLGTKFDNRNG
jgi:hypothetical protein